MALDSLTAYVGAFVDELSQSNIEDVVISPGSRSTPLAMMFAQHPDIHVWLNVDERSAAFFALGIAKSKQSPVALVCTSGTAAANYFPAVIEAYESRIPLLVLTADRPHELRDIGAPQAIDQIGLYGNYVKWFHDMAIPEQTAEMLQYVRTKAARSSAISLSGKKGPVHLNFPFREPLVPNYQSDKAFLGEKNPGQYMALQHGTRDLTDVDYDMLTSKLKNTVKGIIICGPGDYVHATKSILDLADTLNFPIFADPLSQLRYGAHIKDGIIEHYDALLKSEVVQRWDPQLVIRFGAMPVSKTYLQYVKKNDKSIHWIIDEGEGWRDPTHLGGQMFYTDPEKFAARLSKKVTGSPRGAAKYWLQQWKAANSIADEQKKEFVQTDEWFEGNVFARLQKLIPEHSNLFVGNSMPIRDLDSFFGKTMKSVQTLANRGANGIDGVVSTALGVATSDKPTVLVIGDLSFYHDMNGLLAAKQHGLNITIILVNNGGGGIFSFLPQSNHPDHFEHLFGTPIEISFQKAVSMYGGYYQLAHNWNHFNDACESAFETKGLNVIEILTDRQQNVELHRLYWDNITSSLLNWWESCR